MEKPATGTRLAGSPAPARPARRVGSGSAGSRDLADSWGEAALVNGQQVALFRVGRMTSLPCPRRTPPPAPTSCPGAWWAPAGRTHTIASPLHKEVYSLATGECFGRPDLHLGTYPVRVVDGAVEVAL